jgi:hypothetical protein
MFPNTIQNLEYDTEQEHQESYGPASQVMQHAEPVALRYPINLDFEVFSGSFIENFCFSGAGSWAAGSLPSLSFEFCDNYNDSQGDALYGAVCNTLRLSCAPRGILTASTEWLAMHHTATTGFSWTAPQDTPPYVWAKGVWRDSVQGVNVDVHPIAIDITVENNVQELYAMLATLAGTNADYEPSHLLAGYQNVSAEIRAITKHSLVLTDTVDVTLIFTAGGNTFTITLSDGAYRGQRRTIPADDMVQYGVPFVFQSISAVET